MPAWKRAPMSARSCWRCPDRLPCRLAARHRRYLSRLARQPLTGRNGGPAACGSDRLRMAFVSCFALVGLARFGRALARRGGADPSPHAGDRPCPRRRALHHRRRPAAGLHRARADGIVRRIEVRAREPQGVTNWVVFALANNTDEQVDRLIVAPHYMMVGSGLFWPDLGSVRLVNVTPSQGFRPERQVSSDADVYLVTLDPGTTVTFVAELSSPNLPQLYLWEPEAYKGKVNSFTLYNGIVIGIAGLLALFLTILFVVKGIDHVPRRRRPRLGGARLHRHRFQFWTKVFALSPAAGQFWRAAGEAILAATLIVFLFAYLNLGRWNVRYSHVAAGWLVFLAAPGRPRPVRSGDRRRHRPAVAARRRARRLRARAVSRRPTASTVPCSWFRPGSCSPSGCSPPGSPSPGSSRTTWWRRRCSAASSSSSCSSASR